MDTQNRANDWAATSVNPVSGWQRLWADVRAFPWRSTGHTLRERLAADRLAMAAGSLTFMTTISLVPLMTVVLAVFAAFPAFARVEQRLQRWMIESLVPDHIARQVSHYVWQFSHKAVQIGWSGAVVLLLTALALVLTIDRQLNDIWRVRQRRPLAQRVLVYWGLLTLGPLLLAAGLSAGSYALSVSRGWLPALHQGTRLLLDVAGFASVVGGMTALYRYVPNAPVRTRHALIGGVFVALAFEVAQRGLAWYLQTVPTYSAVYGAFATVPILLIWLYLLWLIVLLGAVVVAYLPSLLAGAARRGDTPGWAFQLALEVVAALAATSGHAPPGLTVEGLAGRLRVDPLQLLESLHALQTMGWVGQLNDDEGRWVLLIDPRAVPVAPLANRLLLPEEAATARFWQALRLRELPVAALLPVPPVSPRTSA